MIMRFYLLAGVLLLGAAAYFTVVRQEPEFQSVPAASEVSRLQQDGILPTGPFEEDEEIEHGIFDVPPMDETMLDAALSNMDMGGMDMGGMDMGAATTSPSDDGTMTMPDGSTMPMAEMAEPDDGTMTMPDGSTMPMAEMAEPDDGTMTMPDGSTMPMAEMGTAPAGGETAAEGGTMTMADGSTMPMAEMAEPADGTMTMPDGSTMPMAEMGTAPAGGEAATEGGTMTMAEGSTMPMAVACTGESGFGFCPENASFDREIDISMSEWTFSDLEIEVKEGERIRFNVRNDGKIPHEFMFMSMPMMQAVTYRARRADWNLLEHEALFEKSLLLPDETLSFVAEVQNAGSWMFMCMLPYHMQMGMMGQVATPGAAMEM